MSSDASSPATETTAEKWPVLSLVECRVVGALIEKGKTTPDAYPLSLNALINACNQKSNRDPVMNLSDYEVEETLESCKQKGLVVRVTGSGRVERWRHNIYDAWKVDKREIAILAELLLRGVQTEGELRGRASRMEEIEDLDTLRSILARLAERNLVVYLTPPGQRGTKLTHGFHSDKEIEGLRRYATPVPPPSAAQTTPARSSMGEERIGRLEEAVRQASGDIERLAAQTSELQASVAALQQELANLKQALGA